MDYQLTHRSNHQVDHQSIAYADGRSLLKRHVALSKGGAPEGEHGARRRKSRRVLYRRPPIIILKSGIGSPFSLRNQPDISYRSHHSVTSSLPLTFINYSPTTTSTTLDLSTQQSPPSLPSFTMLLRLVPTPCEANPQPPTILFTLPMPNQPYTYVSSFQYCYTLLTCHLSYSSKGLPLPSQLLAHRSACIQQGIDCSNALLGDKASWLCGAISEVTFVTSAKQIHIQMHDSTERWIELTPACMTQCDKVIEQVTLSFAPAPSSGTVAPLSPPMTPTSPTRSKSAASSFLDGRRQSPSSLLMSLLSPLITSSSPNSSDASEGMFSAQQARASHQGRPTATLEAQRATNPSKFYRRAARSMLVDTYRQFVLPVLKETLPSSYLLFTVEADRARKQAEWNELQEEVETLLQRVSYQRPEDVMPPVLRRPSLGPRGTASISVNRISENAVSVADSSSTLCASVSSSTIKPESITSLAPAMYIATLPPYTELPSDVRITYATMHRRINDCSCRLASLDRLKSDLQLDDTRRAGLETGEMEKNVQKGIRRAYSNGTPSPVDRHLRPVKSSSLRNSVVPQVDADESTPKSSVAPFQMEDQVDEFAAGISVRPVSPSFGQMSDSSEDSSDDEDEEELLMRQEIETAFADFCMASPPALVYNRSAESLEIEDERQDLLPPCYNDHQDQDAMFICPKTPRLGHVSQLSTSMHVDLPRPTPSVLRRFSVDSIDPLMELAVEEEEELETTTRHDEFLVDMLSGRRKSEGMPFSWYQHQIATC